MDKELPPRFDEIKAYYDEDRARGVTTPILRHIIATAVTRSARLVYGKAFATKCMQSSAAVKQLLGRVGIGSQMTAGAVCFLRADANSGKPNMWSGFWGLDHHVWLLTEFDELVDLSISALNEHPMTSLPELPPPALWWPVNLGQPHFFRYLYDVSFNSQEFEDDEALLFSQFMKAANTEFDKLCRNLSPNEFHYPDLLGGEGELHDLIEKKHPYLTVVIQETPETTPLPNWIIERQNELQNATLSGTPAKSRLLSVKGLFKTT